MIVRPANPWRQIDDPSFRTVLGLLLGALDIAAAAAVTVHILLHKRDVGTSISWIGVAWLSPFLGSLFYVVLGINRVSRRGRRLRRRRRGETVDGSARAPTAARMGHLNPLQVACERITGRETLAGNNITVLEHGDEAYPRMLAAIAAAKACVALSTYIFRADATGEEFIVALAAAARRSV